MALNFKLELEGVPPDWKAVRQALLLTGVEPIDWLDQPPPAAVVKLTESGCLVYFEKYENWWDDAGELQQGPRPFVAAEGHHGCKFVVSGGLCFRISSERFDAAAADIKMFLTHLAALSPMQFVLSFQGEGVYALRDRDRGFEWFWDCLR